MNPEAEAAVLADAHRKDTLRRMRAAIFHDANQNEFGVRLSDGRVLYRPTHSEAIALWYAEDARTPTTPRPEQTRKPANRPIPTPKTAAWKGPKQRYRPIEAVDPTTGEVRHRFPSFDAIRAAGFNANCVWYVLAGKRRNARRTDLAECYACAATRQNEPQQGGSGLGAGSTTTATSR